MKKCLFILFISCYCNCFSQSHDFYGLWIGASKVEIKNIEIVRIENISEQDSIPRIIFDEAQSKEDTGLESFDTIFQLTDVLLKIKRNGKIKFKFPEKKVQTLDWLALEDQRKIGVTNKSDSVILELNSPNYMSIDLKKEKEKFRKVIYHQLKPSFFKFNHSIIDTIKNYSWTLYEVDNSIIPKFKLNFENDSLMIVEKSKEININLEIDKWYLESFDGEFFLLFKDAFFPFFLHLTDFKSYQNEIVIRAEKLLSDKTNGLLPYLKKFELRAVKNNNNSEIKIQAEQLLGTWESLDNITYNSNTYNNFEIIQSFYEYTFNPDKTVHIQYYGTLKLGEYTRDFHQSSTKSWEFSRQSNYILLGLLSDAPEVLKIKLLSENVIQIEKVMTADFEGFHRFLYQKNFQIQKVD